MFLSFGPEFGSWCYDTPVPQKACKAVGREPDLYSVVLDCRPIGL